MAFLKSFVAWNFGFDIAEVMMNGLLRIIKTSLPNLKVLVKMHWVPTGSKNEAVYLWIANTLLIPAIGFESTSETQSSSSLALFHQWWWTDYHRNEVSKDLQALLATKHSSDVRISRACCPPHLLISSSKSKSSHHHCHLAAASHY